MGSGPIDPESPDSAYAESRWPMAAAVVAAMALTLLLPDDFRLAPRWVLPLVEGLLLATLIAADPGRITRRSAALRAVSVALISVLALSAIWSTIQLRHAAGALGKDRHGSSVRRLTGHPRARRCPSRQRPRLRALDAGSGVQTKFGHAVDCFAAGRHPELAVERVHLALHGMPGDEQPVTDFGERKVGGQQR
jgi:hypothetical protein